MMKLLRLGLWSSLVMLLAFPLRGQELVQLGKHRLALPANVQTRLRGVRGVDLGAITGGEHNVLIQLSGSLSSAERESLRAKGLELDDYLGSHAYWARLRSGLDPCVAFRGTKLRSVVPVAAEWKLSDLLARGRVPAWSQVGHDGVRVHIYYAANADSAEVVGTLGTLGVESVALYADYGLAICTVRESLLSLVASLPWVRMVSPVSAPRQLMNTTGRSLSRGNYLSLSPLLGGRGLDGEGMRIGIWDGNVVYSPDFGNRVHRMEFQLASGGGDQHGTHVAGTVLGSGMLDPQHQGLAPKAEAWTWNFATGVGQTPESVEMDRAHKRNGITITQNSYGLPLQLMCILYPAFSYNTLYEDLLIDKSTWANPTLLHVYAAGNEQEGCADTVRERYGEAKYGTSANRTKNVLHVGALDFLGRMTPFSSWGPMDDGRLVPTVMAKGLGVRSVQPFDGYQDMNGTSMACPTTSGHLLLVGQRYKQLNQGRDIRADLQRALAANTATDLGNPGPDFQNGYGLLNAEKMVQTLERGWYLEGKQLGVGESFEHKIAVPKGATQARVMIAWDDPSIVKQYVWGDRALVNDLDLTVEGQRPWVCDHRKGHVQDKAQRKEDRLNNMEQVTFSASELEGKSELAIKVKGHEVPMPSQQFALVWWFEVPGALRFTSPAGGEGYEPGETIVAHVEDIAQGGFVLDISYDGGATFTNELARTQESYAIFRPEIPRDAPVVPDAMFRLVDAQGNVARSNPFSIAPVVRDIKLDRGNDPCGVDQWKLTWDLPIYGEATHGYKLLLGDVDTEIWEALGDVEKDATSVDITALLSGKLQGRTSALLTLAAKHADGTWGRRAKAVQAFSFGTQTITPAMLPYAATFQRWPSPRWVVIKGKQRTFDLNPYSDVEVPNGSSVVLTGVDALNPEQEYDTVVPPFDEKNKDYHVELRMCRVDLSAFAAGTRLLLRLRGAVLSGEAKKPKTSMMRVLWDGVPLSDYRGETMQEAKDTDFELMYPLVTDGLVHTLGIQHSGYVVTRTAEDRLLLTGVYIEAEAEREKPDVSIGITKSPVDGADLGTERFELTLINSSVREVNDLEVQAYLNGAWVKSLRLEPLKGSEERHLWFPLDLSTSEPEGKVFDVEFRAVCQGDIYPQDNAAQARVANFGNVIRMPASFYLPRNLDPQQNPQDPNLRYTIGKGKRLFTDDGGILRAHGINQKATVTLLPEDPSMRVRVVFRSFKTQVRQGILDVYTNLRMHESINTSLPIDQLDGEITEKELEELVFVSGAEDGSIRFYFNSTNDDRAVDDGWVAEVDLVPMSNPLSLVDTKIQLLGSDPVADVPVTITVRNNTQKLVPWALLRVADGVLLPVSQPMQNVVLGEKTDELPRKVKGVALRTSKKLLVELLAPDGDMSDNQLTTWMVYDSYCIPQWRSGVDRAIHFGRDTLHLFQEAGTMSAELRYIEHEEFVHSKVWIDWNRDGEFGTDEVVQEGRVDLFESSGSLPFRVLLTGRGEGTYRLRAIYGKETGQVTSPCPIDLSEDTYVRDEIVVVHKGDHPTAGDVELNYVGVSHPEAQKGDVSTDYGAEEPIWIEITNVSHRPWSGKLKVSVSVDGVGSAEEEIEVPAAEALDAWSGRRAFQLNHKADFSAHGMHRIQAEIQELDGRGRRENNTQEAIFHTLRPAASGEWALSSSLHPDPSVPNQPGVYDVVSLEAAASALYGAIPRDGTGAMTVEMWIHPDRKQYGEFFSAEGFRIALTNRMPAQQVRDNGLIVLVGAKMVVYTKNLQSDLILPGQWHHVAVVVKEIKQPSFLVSGHSHVQIYVDGKAVETEVEDDGAPDLRGLINLLARFGGKMDQLRLWSRALSEAEVGSFMHKHMATLGTAEERKGLIAEYSFNEGPKSAGTVSQQGHMAYINTLPARIESEVWVRPFGQLIVGSRFEGQVLQKLQEGGIVDLTFRKDVDLAHVKGGSFETIWPGTQVTYQGRPVTADTEFDFSSGKQVKVKAMLNTYGGAQEQEVTFVGRNDLSDACELLSLALKKEHNPGLAADEDVQVRPAMVVKASGASMKYPQRVKLTFAVSPEAKLFAQMPEGSVELQNEASELDLSQERKLIVMAANGRTHKVYTLRLALEQTLAWAEPQDTYVYGTQPVDLAFQSPTLALNPVMALSSHPDVAGVNAGRLHFGAVGATELLVYQPAQNGYRASDPLRKRITVTPKEVTLRLAWSEHKGGDGVEWQFTYDGLENPNDVALMPDPMEHGDFVVESQGAEYDYRAWGFRDRGDYVLKAKGKPYAVGNYTVKPVDSPFRVVQGTRYRFTVNVKASGAPLEGAVVSVGDTQSLTDAQGVAVCWLVDTTTYSYRVSKSGYSPAMGQIAVAGADVSIDVEIAPAAVWYTYTSTLGGAVYGNLRQHLAEGQSAEPVLAQADMGYHFTEWSDKSTANPRVDIAGGKDAEFQAHFALNAYKLVYTSGGNGTIEGLSEQQVAFGQDGHLVKAVPAEGYYFVAWSDGLTVASRTDTHVQSDVRVEALFRRMEKLPYLCTFDSGEFEDTWAQTSVGEHVVPWEITRFPRPLGNRLDGYYAMVDSDKDVLASFESVLYMPRFALSAEVISSGVNLSFDMYYNDSELAKSELSLEYDCGLGWKVVPGSKLEAFGFRSSVMRTLSSTELKEGKGYVQFRLRYKSTWSYWVLIDNVSIFENKGERITVNYQAEPAGAGTFVSSAGTALSKQELMPGQVGSAIEAQPADGYKFSHWSDGLRSAVRPEEPFVRDAKLVAHFVPLNQYWVLYRSTIAKAVTFIMDGQPIAAQRFSLGDSVKRVDIKVAEGYKFMHWLDNHAQESYRAPELLVGDAERVAVVVSRSILELLPAQLAWRVEPAGAGVLELLFQGLPVTAGTRLDQGDEVNVSYSVNKGYTFRQLLLEEDGSVIPTPMGQAVFVMPAKATLVAQFDKEEKGKPDDGKKTDVAEDVFSALSISPNPVLGWARLDGVQAEDRVSLFNALGQKVWDRWVAMEQRAMELDLSGMPAGVYLLRVQRGGKNHSIRVVKQ